MAIDKFNDNVLRNRKKSEIEALMNEYDSIIDSFIDKSIIKSLEDEFNKLPETYRMNINIELRGDEGRGYHQYGEPTDVISIANAQGTGSDHTVSYNKTAGKRTFTLTHRNTTRMRWSIIQSVSDVNDLNTYLTNITEDVNVIKGIVNPKTDYIVSLTYSDGNSGVNDIAKLKEICGRVFTGKATHVGRNSDYNQDMTQHYRTGNSIPTTTPFIINPNMILKVRDFTTSNIDWEMDEYQENGVEIGVTAWTGNIMIDEHIVEKYSQLETIDLMDEVEGYMSYHGSLTSQGLVTKLISMGFNAILV